MKKRIPLLSTLALAFALLSGCGASGHIMENMTQVTASETAAASVNYNGSYDIGYDTGSYGDSYDTDYDISLDSEVDEAAPQELQTAANLSLSLERKLIRNMNLTVETTDFDSLIQALQKKTAEFQGYIEQSDISGNSITNQGRPSKKYAHMTLRIPADKLDSFISQVESAGNITYKSENVSDVTLQYSDIQSRLKTLRMEQERLWELLAKADTTESIVLLEERLTEVSSEIESCESRIRYLDNSVTYSTVYLDINEVDTESPTQPETAWQQIKRGFTRNLITLMDNLTMFIINLLSNLPSILFFIFLVFLILLIIRRIQKHRKPKEPKTPKKFPISQINFFGSTNTASFQGKTESESQEETTSDAREEAPASQKKTVPDAPEEASAPQEK